MLLVILRIVKGQQLIDSGLGEQIIEFDKQNMKPILEKAGIEFPEEKRRKGLRSNPTFIIAFDGRSLAGYLEYLRSWNDPNYIYVGSIQIDEKYRNTRLILELIDKFRDLVAEEDFVGFETNVQKANLPAVKMYRKIGFRLEENPNNDDSWIARADRRIMRESPVIGLIDKWRSRR
jgi:ribosomal protein S18 acetylase RimI-like enzyme